MTGIRSKRTWPSTRPSHKKCWCGPQALFVSAPMRSACAVASPARTNSTKQIDVKAVGHQDRLGRTMRRSGEQFQSAAASGGRDALARVAARVAYRGHCRCLRDGDAQVEPCRVRTPGRSTPGLGHPQPFPLDAGDERRDAGKLGRRVNRGRDLRNGVAKQPGAILCRHSNVLDCPAETVPQAVEI